MTVNSILDYKKILEGKNKSVFLLKTKMRYVRSPFFISPSSGK